MVVQIRRYINGVTLRAVRGFVLTICLLLAGGYHTVEAAGISYKAGIGYDFLSQQYFLDSVWRDSADAILTEWSLKTDYLDDVKGMMSLTVLPFSQRQMALTTRYEQTSEFFRLKFVNDVQTKLGASRLDLTGEVDWRKRHDGETTFGDSYVFGYGRARFKTPLSASVSAVIQGQGEFVRFDSTSSTSLDNVRGGGKIGLEKSWDNYSFGDIKFTVMGRDVPDSTLMSYVTYGVEGSYLGFYSQGDLDLFARFERKDYNQPDKKNDFWRLEVDGRNKIRLSENYFTCQEVEFDLTDYEPTDPVNIDYYRLEVTFLSGIETLDFKLGIGPELEGLHEDKDDFSFSEDYFEAGAKVDFDYMKLKRLFVSVESVLGYRNLKDNDELLTDYTYERLNVIGDLRIVGGLSLNVLFSAEWEWHRIATNDSEIYLLSSSLMYKF